MIKIETGDFRELSKDIADDSIDLILTDPPYAKEFLPLWADLGWVAAKVLKPGGSLVTYCGNYQILDVGNILSQHLRYWWSLAIEHGGPTARLPGKWVFAHHKPALWFVKGHRYGKRYVADVIKGNGCDKRYHKWGQGINEFRYLIERLTNPGDLVYDPFLGGGTTAVACYQLGRNFIGSEIDPRVAEDARKRLAETQPPLPGLKVIQPGLEESYE